MTEVVHNHLKRIFLLSPNEPWSSSTESSVLNHHVFREPAVHTFLVHSCFSWEIEARRPQAAATPHDATKSVLHTGSFKDSDRSTGTWCQKVWKVDYYQTAAAVYKSNQTVVLFDNQKHILDIISLYIVEICRDDVELRGATMHLVLNHKPEKKWSVHTRTNSASV